MANENYFVQLNSIDVNEHTEKKNNLTYLSWAWAWAEVKKLHPEATYTIYENAQGWNYHTDGKTCWVKTGVTVNGIEHIEYLPVMDYKNASILLERVTSFDVNKAIQRSLTKACARHGLGLYIYAGEDLPETPATEAPNPSPAAPTKAKPATTKAKEEKPAEEIPENVQQLMDKLDLEPVPSAKDIKKTRDIIRAIQTQEDLINFIKDPANETTKKEQWFQTECKDVQKKLKDKGLWK